MRRTICVAALVGAAGFSTAAVAAEHEVLMLGTGYFPEIIHVQPGDTVRFVNAASIAMAATAKDLSWTTGPVIVDGEAIIPVVEGMTMTYDNTLPEVLAGGALGDIVEDTEGTLTDNVDGTIEWQVKAPILLDDNGQPVDDNAYATSACPDTGC